MMMGCPLAMMLFAYAFSKVFEKLRDILAPKEANTEPADKTFLGAIADDAAIIGTPDKAVLMYLHMQKIADEDFNLKFHTPKCAAFSFGLNKNDMIQAMEDAQNDILRDNNNYCINIGPTYYIKYTYFNLAWKKAWKKKSLCRSQLLLNLGSQKKSGTSPVPL